MIITERGNHNIHMALLLFLLITNGALYQQFHWKGLGFFTSIVAILYLYSHKKLVSRYFKNDGVIFWTLLMGFHIVNLFILGLGKNVWEYRFYLVAIEDICMMGIISFLFCRNRKLLFMTLIISLYVYLYIAFIHNDQTDLNERFHAFILSTQLGQMAGLTCLILSLYVVFLGKKPIWWLLYLFPLLIIIICQARNALFPLFISFIVLFYHRIIKSNVLYLIIYLIIAIVGYQYLLTTNLFARVSETSVEGIWKTETIMDVIVSDRAIYYVLGFENFLEHPINGIGLINFSNYNNFDYPLHGEFISHLAEGGIVGFVLYLLFLRFYISNLFSNYSIRNIPQNSMILAFLSLMILGITTREYHYNFFFVIYGLLSGYIYQKNHEKDPVRYPI